jgi:hypothetical protein
VETGFRSRQTRKRVCAEIMRDEIMMRFQVAMEKQLDKGRLSREAGWSLLRQVLTASRLLA